MVKSELSVIRAGKLESRPPGDLVPGDIMKLCSGVKIPADAVLFHASNLRVDMSSLTGESMSVDKKPLENGAKDTIEAHESSNMVFSSNIVVSGMLLV